VEYSIQGGKLNGPWLLYNRKGEIVESGLYKNGNRRGTWLYRTEEENEAGYGKITRLQSKQF
jgi:antitoxin component YwqK of YwqJK toxin-antitoxin module